MGFSYERQAAARTVLRARATGDQNAIDDAETAVSGYLGHEDLDDYIAEHYPNGLADEKNAPPAITSEHLAQLRGVAENARGFYPVPWVRVGEKNVSVIERSPRDGSISGGGPVAEAGHEVFAEHIVTFEPSTVLELIAALEEHAQAPSPAEPTAPSAPDPINDPVVAQHNHAVSQQVGYQPPSF